jgi:kumamolisin
MYARPPWQKSVGPPLASAPGRLVPDVSSNADYLNMVEDGKNVQTWGTSAAAPFWSGLAALIDQDLARHGLRRMGVPLAALAWIAAHQSTYHAFHDVARGNNLFFKAVPGWDEATGWGSPDGAKLDAAFIAYMKGKGA